MGQQDHDTVRCHLPQIGKDLFLRLAIQCGKRIVQDQDRTLMAQGSRQCQPLCLSTGESDATISHNGVHTLFHLCHLTVETDCLQILLRIVIIAQQYIVTDTIIEQLRIVS